MKKKLYVFPIIIFIISILLNSAAWNSPQFCDFYLQSIFPYITKIYGSISSFFPFSLGEVLIIFGLIWVIFTILLFFTAIVFLCFKQECKHKKFFDKINTINFNCWIYAVSILFLIQTLNCFISYHATPFREQFFNGMQDSFQKDDIIELRNQVVKKVNDLSQQVERDEKGVILYEKDMKQVSKEAMLKLSSEIPQLKGYYVTFKELSSSDFISQQYMQGYYLPFAMEATINGTMNKVRKPATICHELAHTKGFIYEDEANFIGYLACINSDDVFFQYSGYLSVLNYIEKDFIKAIGNNKNSYDREEQILDQVKKDNTFLSQEQWERIEEKAILKTEVVKATTHKAVNASLVANGVKEGSISYENVVILLLQYQEQLKNNLE